MMSDQLRQEATQMHIMVTRMSMEITRFGARVFPRTPSLRKLNQLGIKSLSEDTQMETSWQHHRADGILNHTTRIVRGQA